MSKGNKQAKRILPTSEEARKLGQEVLAALKKIKQPGFGSIKVYRNTIPKVAKFGKTEIAKGNIHEEFKQGLLAIAQKNRTLPVQLAKQIEDESYFSAIQWAYLYRLVEPKEQQSEFLQNCSSALRMEIGKQIPILQSRFQKAQTTKANANTKYNFAPTAQEVKQQSSKRQVNQYVAAEINKSKSTMPKKEQIEKMQPAELAQFLVKCIKNNKLGKLSKDARESAIKVFLAHKDNGMVLINSLLRSEKKYNATPHFLAAVLKAWATGSVNLKSDTIKALVEPYTNNAEFMEKSGKPALRILRKIEQQERVALIQQQGFLEYREKYLNKIKDREQKDPNLLQSLSPKQQRAVEILRAEMAKEESDDYVSNSEFDNANYEEEFGQLSVAQQQELLEEIEKENKQTSGASNSSTDYVSLNDLDLSDSSQEDMRDFVQQTKDELENAIDATQQQLSETSPDKREEQSDSELLAEFEEEQRKQEQHKSFTPGYKIKKDNTKPEETTSTKNDNNDNQARRKRTKTSP